MNREDSMVRTPKYVEAFRAQRWEAFRVNRKTATDSLQSGAHALALVAKALKAQGYRSVVLAGDSFGAFISLIAADLTDDVDAVIAVAPAAFGPVEGNPPMGALNALRLYPVLQQIRRAKVMLFFFRNDIFDPGGRGPRSEQILSARRLPHLVIDRPVALQSHWAGSTTAFANRFGACMVAFATGQALHTPDCRDGDRSTASFRDKVDLPEGKTGGWNEHSSSSGNSAGHSHGHPRR